MLELPIELDSGYRNQSGQVHAALRSAIVEGRLESGAKLPSSRSLAGQLGVARNAVVAAYEHLVCDGLAEARHGSGTYVTRHLPAQASRAEPPEIGITPRQRRPFALGHTLVEPSLLRRLATRLRDHVVTAAPAELGYADPRGSEHLRTQIAEHLAAHRGVRCDPGCVVVVSGIQHGLRLCVDALLTPGDAIWMEEPGYYATQTTLRAAGMKLVPVPVDEEGLDVAAGLSGRVKARAAYVTPSHQFPTGVTMSMRRRLALIEWARANESWIIEDDYDSEFRFEGPPLTALAGVGAERVIYMGTFSKTLFAGLRLAYLVLPPSIVERVTEKRAMLDRFPPTFTQDAVADLMADGTIVAHIRRVRVRYREARDVVIETLSSAAGDVLQLAGPAHGLHLVARLPEGLPEGTASQIRARAGIDARLLSEARLIPSGADGFILGYSGHDLDELRKACHRLGETAREVVGARTPRTTTRKKRTTA